MKKAVKQKAIKQKVVNKTKAVSELAQEPAQEPAQQVHRISDDEYDEFDDEELPAAIDRAIAYYVELPRSPAPLEGEEDLDL